MGGHGGLARGAAFLALRRLRGVRSQEPVLEGRSIKTPDDRLHFICGGRLHEREALGFLCFVVSNHLHTVRHQIFGGEPLLDIVCGDPGWEIAKKYGKAHSVILLLHWLDLRHFKGKDSDLPPR